MGPLVLEELFRGVHEVAGESGRQLRYSFRVGPLILEEVLRRHHRRDQLHIGRQAKNGWRTANRAIRESLIPTNEISFMLTIMPLTKSGVIAANCLRSYKITVNRTIFLSLSQQIMQTCTSSLASARGLSFGLITFRSSIQDGTKSYCLWSNSHLITSWTAVQINDSRT